MVKPTPDFNPSTIKWKFKSLILFSGLFSLGLIFLVISLIPQVAANPFFASLFGQLSTALIISGLYTGISEFVLRQDFIGILQSYYRSTQSDRDEIINQLQSSHSQDIQKICDLLPLQQTQEKTGLITLTGAEEYYDIENWIEQSETFIILFRDGKSWVSRHRKALKQRFQDSQKETIFILLDPEDSEFEQYAALTYQEPEALRYKISATVEYLKQLTTESTNLKILGHKTLNTYHAIVADSRVLVTLYPCSGIRFKPPSFIFEDVGEQGYYHYLKQDLEALMETTRDISEYKKE